MRFLDRQSEHILEVRDLTPTEPNFLLVVDDFLTPTECRRFIGAIEDGGVVPMQGPSPSDLKPRKNEALLNRDSAAVTDSQLCDVLWSRLAPLLPVLSKAEGTPSPRFPLGLVGDGKMGIAVPNQLKFYRYVKGHSFGLHVDVSRRGPGPAEATDFTLLVYLNSQGEPVPQYAEQPLAGGDTVFMKTARQELLRVSPKQGSALLHAHGSRCLLHEAEAVAKGAKYVLRADVMYGPEPPK